MKPSILIPIIALAGGIAINAQTPNPPPPPPAPQGNPQQQPGPGDAQNRREMFRHRMEQFRQHHGGPGAQGNPMQGSQNVNPQEREMHVREALKHLHAAGLGMMAERIEHALKEHAAGGQHQAGPGGASHHSMPQAQGPQQPQAHGPRPPSAGPQAFAQPAPMGPQHQEHHREHGNRPQHGQSAGNDELRQQVQTLAHQVEELRNLIRSRLAEHGRDSHAEPRRGDHPQNPPAAPQSRQRPQGDQPPQQPQGGRPHGEREHRDGPPPQPQGERPRGQASNEQVKPAERPQSEAASE